MQNDILKDQALDLVNDGYELQMNGELDEAIELYSRSIELCPTAEAFTFRGWSYSDQGRLDEAIEECYRAIDTDPEFGNAYNDIGAYLIEKGEFDEAIPWLEQAIVAKRYDSRYFPWMNLGRIYEQKGAWRTAIDQYRHALKVNPDYTEALTAIRRLEARMN